MATLDLNFIVSKSFESLQACVVIKNAIWWCPFVVCML